MRDLKSLAFTGVRVQVPLSVQNIHNGGFKLTKQKGRKETEMFPFFFVKKLGYMK
jgi:hypothetical protein